MIIGCFSFSTISFSQDLEGQFQHIIDSVYAENDSVVGMLFHIEAPDHQISWTSAVGLSEQGSNHLLTKEHPVLIASNTKTFVGAAILKLVEQGQIKLDQPIEQIIHKNSRKLLKQDGYNLKNITVRHLLSHTSGIADYVNDDYFEFVNTKPKYKWKRSEQIQLATEVGDPLYQPGTNYKYADINFLLLTEIIEQKTDQPFYTAIRTLLDYKKHGLESTWFINLEEQPNHTLKLAHQYWEKKNWDSYNINPSWDLYGGGGLASTTKDLALFFTHLFQGDIIQDKTLLKDMCTLVLPREKSIYALGVMNILFHGKEAYYHGGFWGSNVMYIPELNVTISAVTLKRDFKHLNPEISQQFVKLLESINE